MMDHGLLQNRPSGGKSPRARARLFTVLYLLAIVGVPSILANTPPHIAILEPAAGASFLLGNETLIVEIEDDEPMPDEYIPFLLNGVRAQGDFLAIGQENGRRKLHLELIGALAPNHDYEFEVIATDSAGATNSARIYFDTFDPESVVIEAEDYNFESGLFIDQPIVLPEGESDASAFGLKVGTPGIDFYDTTLTPSPGMNAYRPFDAVGVERSADLPREKFIRGGGPSADVFDYSVTRIRNGEWLNYGRGFPRLSYRVRLRQSLEGLPQSATLLSLVTGDPASPGQAAIPAGMFLGQSVPGRYRTIPLTDGVGKEEVVLRLTSEATVRLTQLTDDPTGNLLSQNFLVFIPVADPGLLPPIIAQVSPWPGSIVPRTDLVISAEILQRDTTVNTGSIQLNLNGNAATPSVADDGSTVTVAFVPSGLPAGATNFVEIRYADILGANRTRRWSFMTSTENPPRLESALQVSGPYALEALAVVDTETAVIRAPINAREKFYRLSLVDAGQTTSPIIDAISLEATNVVIRYRR